MWYCCFLLLFPAPAWPINDNVFSLLLSQLGCLVGWKAFTFGGFPYSLNFGTPFAHRLVALDWLAGGLVDRLAGWLLGWLACWLLGLLAGKLLTPVVPPILSTFGPPLRVDWLRWTGWLVDWLDR